MKKNIFALGLIGFTLSGLMFTTHLMGELPVENQQEEQPEIVVSESEALPVEDEGSKEGDNLSQEDLEDFLSQNQTFDDCLEEAHENSIPLGEDYSDVDIVALANQANITDDDVNMIYSAVIDGGVSVDSADDKYGSTALHYAAKFGHNYLAYVLVCYLGADINATSKNGRTPLHFAAGSGNSYIVKILCDLDQTRNQIDLDAHNDEHFTALHGAVYNGHADVVRQLVLYGADVLAKGQRYYSWYTPRDVANSQAKQSWIASTREVYIKIAQFLEEAEILQKEEAEASSKSWFKR